MIWRGTISRLTLRAPQRFRKSGQTRFAADTLEQTVVSGPLPAHRSASQQGAAVVAAGTRIRLVDADYGRKLIQIRLPSGALLWVTAQAAWEHFSKGSSCAG